MAKEFAAWWPALSLVLSAILGALGGVLVAGQIAWRSTRANDRYRAGTEIRAVLSEYRRTIEYTQDQLPNRDHYPADYVDLPGQYKLVRDALEPAGVLSRRKRRKLEEALIQLVGNVTFRGAQRTVGVRPDAVDHDWEARQMPLEQTKAVLYPESGDKDALLRRLVTNHGDVEAREQAVALLEQLEHLVRRD
jgi:hypothetical protein